MAAPTITGTVSNGHSTGSVASLTISHTSNGDNLFVLVVSEQQTEGGLCEFDGVPMVFLGHVKSTGNLEMNLAVYFLPSVSAVTTNIVYTPDSPDFLALAGYNVNGAVGGTRIAVSDGNDLNPIITAVGYSNELMLDIAVNYRANNTWTVGAGQTSLFEEEDASTEYKIASSTKPTGVSVTMEWAINAEDFGWSEFMIALIGSGSGGEQSHAF